VRIGLKIGRAAELDKISLDLRGLAGIVNNF